MEEVEFRRTLEIVSKLIVQAKYDDACRLAMALTNVHGDRSEAYLLAAQSQIKKGDLSNAEKILEQAYKVIQGDKAGLALAAIKSQLEKYEEALALFDQYLLRNFESAQQLFLYAKALAKREKFADSKKVYEECIRRFPDHLPSLNNLANTYQKEGLVKKAILKYQAILKLGGENAMVLNNLAGLQHKLGEKPLATSYYERAIELDSQQSILYYNLGMLYFEDKDYTKALTVFDKGLQKSAGDYISGIHILQILTKHYLFDWNDYVSDVEVLEKMLETYLKESIHKFQISFSLLNETAISPMLHKQLAMLYANKIKADVHEKYGDIAYNISVTEGKINVGYLVTTFSSLLLKKLFAELIDHHDSRYFEVHIFSENEDDLIEQTIIDHADYYHDVTGLSSIELADLINRTGIDVLVSVGSPAKMEVLALKPVPIQVVMFGDYKTTGADFIDYIVLDKYFYSEQISRQYTERVMVLPTCLIPYSNTLSKDFEHGSGITRVRLDVPDNSFVFAALVNLKMLDPASLNNWVAILKQAPNAVLVLCIDSGNKDQMKIENYFIKNGVESGRVFFDENHSEDQCFHGLNYADVILNDFNQYSYIMVIQALQLGKPVIAKKGGVGASFLHSMKQESMVAETSEEYIRLAVKVASDESKELEIMANQVQNEPVFDIGLYAKYLEKSFRRAMLNFRNKSLNNDIIIDPSLKFDIFN